MHSEEFFHSVRLDAEKCKGCTNCIKRCPTGAIRVRQGKAYIISERCIDCGECIRICPHHAKYAEKYSFNEILDYKYRIALPAPTLYGQFNNLDDVDYVLNGLLRLGFDDVFEVSVGAELVSEATRLYMKRDDIVRPVISSACPAIVRLIRVRFPNLIPNVLEFNAPTEEAARLARVRAKEKPGFPTRISGCFSFPRVRRKLPRLNSRFATTVRRSAVCSALKTFTRFCSGKWISWTTYSPTVNPA